MTSPAVSSAASSLTQTVLDTWERASGQTPVARALTLLSLGQPHMGREALEVLSAGALDRGLLELRLRLFGPLMANVADCPNCGERLEFELQVESLLLPHPDPDTAQERIFQFGEVELTYRLPNSLDLMRSSAAPDPESFLRRTCVLNVRRDGEDALLDEISPELWDALSAVMGEADPQARPELALTCPLCAHTWNAPLNVSTYLWRELSDWAGGVLQDVHELALAYGWCEADTLGLSPTRRQHYLELLRG